jgi:glycosyltransferase involved in cell wall biosynthesis
MTPDERSLRILITNNALAGRGGSELYVRDLALGLIRRGHRPVVYSTILGEVAESLHRATVPVVDDLDALGFVLDVIHGQHHLETMTAVLRFPEVPAIYFCHGWLPWEELPPVFPSIVRYVAVDDLCAERLLSTNGIDASRVDTIYNGVDLERFASRPPLPDRAQSALIFSNYAGATGYAERIRAACVRFGIERVDVAGAGAGKPSYEPEAILPQYDIVFAKARCALEAMATGCATVVADNSGLAGMVGTDNFAAYRRLNFGVRTMQGQAVTEDAVLEQLRRYQPNDAAQVSALVRADASFAAVVDRIVATYRQVLAQPPLPTPGDSAAASAAYLKSLSPRLKAISDAEWRAKSAQDAERNLRAQLEVEQTAVLREQLETEQARRATLERQGAECATALLALRAESAERDAELQSVRQQHAEVREQLAAIHGSRSWRVLAVYRRFRAWLA